MTLQQAKKDAKLLATRLKNVWLVLHLSKGNYKVIQADDLDKKDKAKIKYTAKPETITIAPGTAKKVLRNLKQKKYRDIKKGQNANINK